MSGYIDPIDVLEWSSANFARNATPQQVRNIELSIGKLDCRTREKIRDDVVSLCSQESVLADIVGLPYRDCKELKLEIVEKAWVYVYLMHMTNRVN